MSDSKKTPGAARRRPRLALLTLDFMPDAGGVQEYLYEICQRLAHKYEVVVITPVKGTLPSGAQLERISLEAASVIAFWRYLRRLRPAQVIVGHAHPLLLMAAALYGSYATIAYGNDFLAAQRRWHRALFNRLLQRSQPLITISRASAERLRQVGAGSAFIVRPGANKDRFTPQGFAPDSAPPIVITVGRLVPRKGVDTVLKALPQLLHDYPDLTYLIVGDGPDRQRLEEVAGKQGLQSTVRFLGRVPAAELPSLYRSATVFIMLSRDDVVAATVEGFGIVFLEASASGIPVIAARSGGSAEAVRDGETGLLIEPDNPAQAARAMAQLLGDRARARHMGLKGRAWVEQEMNWDRAGREMLQLLTGGTLGSSQLRRMGSVRE